MQNFLALCASGKYNGTTFHRLIPSFMIQGGDVDAVQSSSGGKPQAAGKGGSSIWGQPFEDEIRLPALRHNGRGIVAMANKGPNTNGSQFYITFGKAEHLNGKNTVFGKVIEGGGEEPGQTLAKMEKVEVDGKNRPTKEVVKIDRVTVHANPLAG
jgi:peptidyl-prolyl cis-trans isomerase-like 3